MGKSEEALNSILEVKYTSPNGALTNVFDYDKESMVYTCRLCSVTCNSVYCLDDHAHGKKHQRIIRLVGIHRPQQLKSETDNPQNRDQVKTSKLQLEIDNTKIGAIIGLEYIIESSEAISNSETYYCVLCKYTFHRKSHVISHLTASEHRLKYLQKHFPRVFEEINYLTEIVCEAIEENFGRLSVLLVDDEEFRGNKHKFTDIVMNMKHIDENMGSIDLLKAKQDSSEVECVPDKIETVSISRESSSENDASMPVDAMSSNSLTVPIQEDIIKIRDQENATSSTPIHIEQKEDKVKDQHDDKIELYRLQLATATKDLRVTYLTYMSSPYTYPGYYDKWVVFWNTHYKEFRSSNTTESHDWQLAWYSEWSKILKESFEKDIQLKRCELKERLGITDFELVENKQVTTPSSKDEENSFEDRTGDVETHDAKQSAVSKIRLCTTLRGSSASRSHSPRKSHNPPRCRRSRSPQKYSSRNSQYSPPNRRKSYYFERSAARRSYSPRNSRSPRKIHSNRRSSMHHRYADGISNQTSEKHQPHLTSWKQLLKISNIDDSDNVPTPPIINDNATDAYGTKEIVSFVKLNKCNQLIQHQPLKSCYASEELDGSESNSYVDKSVTIISVLQYFNELKDLLGPCLGPKLMELMHKAVSMDESNTNSSNTLLDDNDSYILLQTIKEKLKGLLIAGLVEGIKQNSVKKAIKDMDYLLQQTTEREKIDHLFTHEILIEEETSPMPLSKDVSEEEKSFVSTDVSGYEDKTLTDSELLTIIEKYSILSENEKQDFIDYIKRLASICPGRIKRLKSVQNAQTQPDLNENLDETIIVISDEENLK